MYLKGSGQGNSSCSNAGGEARIVTADESEGRSLLLTAIGGVQVTRGRPCAPQGWGVPGGQGVVVEGGVMTLSLMDGRLLNYTKTGAWAGFALGALNDSITAMVLGTSVNGSALSGRNRPAPNMHGSSCLQRRP